MPTEQKPTLDEAIEEIKKLRKRIADLKDQRTHEIDAKNKTIRRIQEERDALTAENKRRQEAIETLGIEIKGVHHKIDSYEEALRGGE